ncbi:nucleoside diphosphate kinase B [Tribonema minus]|uniref:Nucleoside diphosphate kinase n=1 Tax=Tribonema minus TaxID=303371 RepID=A0A835YSZ5_9STRA|nr:nucleoside diphosphate kinase B [Tribonema minus]
MLSRVATASRQAARPAVRALATHAKVAAAAGRPFAAKAVTGLAAAAVIAAAAAQQERAECAAFPYTGVAGTGNERSFIAIKPDGVQRGLIAEVISRFEKKGYKLVAMKMIWATEEMAANHYDDLKGRPFFPALVKYFASGPIVAMVWEGPDVIKTGRKILGATNPQAADVGTLRGDFCLTTGRNIIHGSDGPESAAHEIGMWFTEKECSAYSRSIDSWIVADN